MLKSIDVLLGLSVVMLIASMAVTVLTQLVTNLRNSRGQHLARGLGDLLQQIDPTLPRTIADQISIAILTHPLISHFQGLSFLGTKLGDTIHREEFIKLLMDMATGQSFGLDEKTFPPETRDRLLTLLKTNGIEDPAATLDNVRAYALQLEQANPELATNIRHSMALMQEANSRLIAKVNSWFDQTIDRVADRFTASTRVVTVLCSVVVVLAVQLDTIDVINRLSLDDALRDKLVAQAVKLDQAQTTKGETKSDKEQNSKSEAKSETGAGDQLPSVNVEQVKSNLRGLQDSGLINIIGSGNGNWCKNWQNVSPIGILLSVVLVSLGAPFWYGALKNLLKLRGIIAGKDDQQRFERQSTQAPAVPLASNPGAAAVGSSPLAGERGILG